MQNCLENNGRTGNAGFTLLETLIAMAIMVVAFTSILAVESGSINASNRGKQMNIVAMLAKERMVWTEYQFEGKTFEEYKKEEAGAFEAPYQDYRWQTTVKEITFPSLNFNPGKSGGAGGGTTGSEGDGGAELANLMTKLITNFLSKAVREVTVTVFWKKGSGEQHYSLSTYWVDLNHEFQLSE